MKRSTLLIIAVFMNAIITKGAEPKHLWPVSNSPFGSNIIYTPGSYIGKELNDSYLFLGGKKGSYIVSPVDGKIVCVFYQYLHSLTKCDLFEESYYHQIKNAKNSSSVINPLFISLLVGIEIAPGDILYISGMEKERLLKTGKKIKQGDTLGILTYAYKEVNVPALVVGRSVNGKSADPMELLGLKTTFILSCRKVNPLQQKDPDKLKADFLVFRESLEEGHPGLYDYISKQKLDKIFDSIFQSLDTPLSILDFEKILNSVVQVVRDKHTQFLTDYDKSILLDHNKRNHIAWPVRIGWEGESLLVTRATNAYKSLVGKTITSINGISADILKKRAERYCFNEGYVQSTLSFFMFTTWMTELPDILNLQDDKSLFIVFKDGTNVRMEALSNIISGKKCDNQVLPSWNGYIGKWNRDITWNLLNDSTAMIDLSTFSLNDVQTDSILSFIKTITLKRIPNLIIDVRYNNGGGSEDMKDIFSLFANRPFRVAEAELVNSNGTYNFFQYTHNYNGFTDLFGHFERIKGKSGYWLPLKDIPEYYPNDTIHYDGHIYILANEHSFSAASAFVGLMRKYKLGMIIGRETANPYSQMYADKFAHVQLPNTQIVVRIPLIKIVFDTTKNSKIVYGRGVMPDYEVPIERGELEFLKDAYVEKATELIAQRIFLKPEKDLVVEKRSTRKLPFFILAAFIFIAIISSIYYRFKMVKPL